MKQTFYIISSILLLLLPLSISAQKSPKPWVTNVSQVGAPTQGLAGSHITVWPSHGRYFNISKGQWEWQRPQLYCTTEDLFTQTFVIPYLIPMLENAGANVFVPRERDWQTEERVVDNDSKESGYSESDASAWQDAPRAGFRIKSGPYTDADHLFAQGTARMTKSTHAQHAVKAFYRPMLERDGKYAVYVSYQTVDQSVDDAEYTVVHQGQSTVFHVNQQMGSGTWVYLGSFDFDANKTADNYVVLSSKSSCHDGIVTTDAVRFGGGMGQHMRGGKVSGLPRALEGARYYTHYAGAPMAVATPKGGTDDYADDINSRTLMNNWLSYGSVTNPTDNAGCCKPAFDVEKMTYAEAFGKARFDEIVKQNRDSFGVDFPDEAARHYADSVALAATDSIRSQPFPYINVMNGEAFTGRVPIEMTLALHSDAGWQRDFRSIYGTLGICTTNYNNGNLASGASRSASSAFIRSLVSNVSSDLKRHFRSWASRDVWDKNYGETRLPAQPSAILEMLSHQSFPDMKLGHDPYFKFVISRAIYKTMVQFLASQHGLEPIIQPLTPKALKVSKKSGDKFSISWTPEIDESESTANPDGYILYTRVGSNGYDNGTMVKGTNHTVTLKPNTIYRFRVAATNKGGRSFPSEELVAQYCPEAKQTVMIVNGFHRLSSPAVVENDTICGFDINEDVGLSYGKTPAWCGEQTVFSKRKAGYGVELGTSNNDLMGRFTAGNDFNYAYSHADAIAHNGKYNIVSMSSEAINDDTSFNSFALVDVLLGNEKNDGHSLLPYKTFTPAMQRVITAYKSNGGRILVSGSYVASDMKSAEEKEWLAATFNVACGGTDRDSQAFRTDSISDLIHLGDLTFSVYRHVNEEHYASVASDIIAYPNATDALTHQSYMRYNSGSQAAIANAAGKSRTMTMGFPFECIKTAEQRHSVMKQLLLFLMR